jgi:hypothetical protein
MRQMSGTKAGVKVPMAGKRSRQTRIANRTTDKITEMSSDRGWDRVWEEFGMQFGKRAPHCGNQRPSRLLHSNSPAEFRLNLEKLRYIGTRAN